MIQARCLDRTGSTQRSMRPHHGGGVTDEYSSWSALIGGSTNDKPIAWRASTALKQRAALCHGPDSRCLSNRLESGVSHYRTSAVCITARCGRAASSRRSELSLLLGTRRMRLQHLPVEDAGEFAFQLLAQLREGVALPVRGQCVRATPLLAIQKYP